MISKARESIDKKELEIRKSENKILIEAFNKEVDRLLRKY